MGYILQEKKLSDGLDLQNLDCLDFGWVPFHACQMLIAY